MPSRKSRDVGLGTAYSRLRRSTRQTSNPKQADIRSRNGIPDVYQEMLAENKAHSDDYDLISDTRPAKKRKVESDQRSDIDDLFESPPLASPASGKAQSTHDAPSRPQQIVYDDFEDSDESDVEFEDVELDTGDQPGPDENAAPAKSLQLDLSKSALEPPKRIVQRRKPVSKAEREMRLDVHKWHLLSLMGHGLHRNSWCNSEEVHALLKPLVPRKLVRLFHTDESKPLSERNHSFTSGVKEICALWRQLWKTTMPGMRRAYWREDVNASDEAGESEDLDFEDFKDAAHTQRGSRDLGAQLFTALLRSIAVDVRLVFSLQVLPFTGAAKAEISSTSKTNPSYIHAPPQNYGSPAIEVSPFAPPSKRIKKPKQIIDSEYPIFWTEILTPNQTWSPLDPVAQNSIAKPKTKFEPPLSDKLNGMSYVIAFEEGSTIRDVTRRYTQYYNGKTRKLRVESTKQGEQWYESVLSVLQKRHRDSRDDLEDDELARRTNTEGMPPNIQDFKNHPVYVLERHMRVNEVLQPKREVGKVNVGTAKNGKIESVYRRQDVHLCRSADAWYRRGRDVRVGEQPLKHVIPKSTRGARGVSAELSDDEGGEGVGLYAEYQTDIYEPPPVVNGQIPKNAYGNLDIYVQSMIPPGAVHISHPLAASAARILNIDFADAVTGFEFKGRQGTAVVQGIVVAQEFTAAVALTIDGLEVLGSEEVQEARSGILLGMWKKMLQALRVRDRIDAEYGTPKTKRKTKKQRVVEDSDEEEDQEDNDDDDDSVYHDNDEDMDNDAEGGGFMPEDEPTEEKVQDQTVNLQILKSKMPAILPEEVVRVPIKITRSPHKLPTPPSPQELSPDVEDDLFEDNDVVNDADDMIESMGVGFLPEDTDAEQYEGGGFVPEDVNSNNDNETGGGFMVEDDNEDISAQQTIATPKRPSKKTDALDYLKPDPDATANAHTDLESLHSDAEEDTALQLAIAESLLAAAAAASSKQSDTATKPENSTGSTKSKDNSKEEAHNKIDSSNQKLEIPTTMTGVNSKTIEDADSPLSATSSMLSHDPNDDDEDPEWLNEALDD